MASTTTDDKLVHLKPSEISVIEGHNPRSKIEGPAFDQLCESVKQDGVLTPVLVTLNEKGKYELVAGHRRVAAAVKTKLATIPVMVRESINGDAKAIAVVENLQRDDLNPIDEAQGFRDAMEALGCNQAALAKRLSISQAHVSERLRLLTLPEQVREWVAGGDLPAVVGKTLSKIGKSSEALAVHIGYWCTRGEVEATKLDKELRYAIGVVFDRLENAPDSLPEIGFVVNLRDRIDFTEFDFGDEAEAIAARLDELRNAYEYPRWTEDDVDAARAFGCLLEITEENEWGGPPRVIPLAFDHDFLRERIPAILDSAEKKVADHKKAEAAAHGRVTGSTASTPEEAKKEARKARAVKDAKRASAHERNKDFGTQIRLKFHKTPLTKERVEALLIGFVEGNDDLASAGIALCDDRLITEEHIERKNGTTRTKITVLDRGDAHAALIERIRKAKTVEEMFGVVWQAMIAAEYADQGSRPDSDRRAWSHPGGYASDNRSVLPRAVTKDALKVLPASERKAAEKRFREAQ